MIVEGQGMDFWTRVRLPSGPLKVILIKECDSVEDFKEFPLFFVCPASYAGRYPYVTGV